MESRKESLYNKNNKISSGFPTLTLVLVYKMLHLVDDKCETQGYIMAARFKRSIPKHVKMKILDDEIKLNMLGKSEMLGSVMETRAQNWA